MTIEESFLLYFYEIATLPMVARNDIGSSNFGTMPIFLFVYRLRAEQYACCFGKRPVRFLL